MKLNISLLLLIFCVAASAVTSQAKTSPEILAQAAVSADPKEAAAAIAELRAAGPYGLSILLRIHSDEINRQIATPAMTPEWQRLSSALDAISQQKDSYLSGLYWYTDLNQAEAAARASGKPILSLRLLGKLSDELSCANSRFFRTILYSNLEVSYVLREQFILHWQSVRPVPRVTIDFGDGRKLESTITGNSIHYVLDSNGQPLDALPGLYGPESFLRSLAEIRQLHERLKRVPAEARFQMLDDYHRTSVRTLTANWLADAQKAGGKIPEYLLPKSATTGTARAVEIAPLAVTKRITEVSLLKAITRDAEALGVVTDEPTWTRIALQHIGDAKLDDRSFSLILRQTKDLFPIRRSSDFNPQLRLASLVQKLQRSIAMDTVRNEYMLRPKLHAWLAVDPSRANLEALNEKVYAELFLTPKTDPWLGLFSPEVYNGLEGAGVTP